jgi:riboflavin kinase/FMN adenylyltransferase
VERGDQRGRTLGFPTANLSIANLPVADLPDGTTLKDGVYAGWLDRGAGLHLAAVSIGGRPTFYGGDGFRLLEAHVLDFDDDIYGETVTVWLCHTIRGQHRFPSLDALVTQLHADIEACRQWSQSTGWEPAETHRREHVPLGTAMSIAC